MYLYIMKATGIYFLRDLLASMFLFLDQVINVPIKFILQDTNWSIQFDIVMSIINQPARVMM